MAGEVFSGIASKGTVEGVKTGSYFWEMETEVRQHVRVLRSFPGEEESQSTFPRQGFFEKIDTASVFDSSAFRVLEAFNSVSELFPQIFQRGGHNGQAIRSSLQPHVQGVSYIKQSFLT